MHPLVQEFEWCDGGVVSVFVDRVRSGSVCLEPCGVGDPEWVVNRVGVGVDGFVGEVGGVVREFVSGWCLDEVVCWRGSVREWRVGEWAEPHSDVFDDGGVLTVSDVLWHRWGDFSVVLFLESGGGGELFFPGLGVEVVPRPGWGVVFPSQVLHGVRGVVGSRLSCVLFLSRARVLAGLVREGVLPVGWDVDCLDAGPVWGLL